MTSVSSSTPRNAPCPCGSGRRFKDCHGALAAPADARPLEELLPAALAAQQSGRLDEAAMLYEMSLERSPDLFDALHMLGVVHFQRHDFATARPLIARAVALRPDIADARRNLRLVDNALVRMQARRDYQTWIATVERLQREARAPLRAGIGRDAAGPLISVILPTYDPPEAALRACLDSVLAQDYPRWELCIADDASRLPHVREVLADYAGRDARIKVDFRARNGHISAASNSAVALASGEWLALLDHDDALPPHALGEVALELREHPDAAIVYSDEDKIDEAGLRSEPNFKPDWNPTLMTSQNFVSHLGVYRRALVREVGGFREGNEGAQDWDLVLRCAERVPEGAIRHIPQMLYHWRTLQGSTARSMAGKEYAASAQERVVAAAFERRGTAATLRRVLWGTFLEAVPRATRPPTLSFVVLSSEGSDIGRWRALAVGKGAEFAAVAAPAGVLDGTSRTLGRPAAEGINAAVAAAAAEVIVIVDAAIEPPPAEQLAAWCAHAATPESGPVGALLLDRHRDIAGSSFILVPDAIALAPWLGEPEGFWGMAGRGAVTQNVSAVRIDAMAVRRECWRALGGLDTRALSDRYFDVDFGLRSATAGWRPVWFPGAVLVHAQAIDDSAVARARSDDADATTMRARWSRVLERDPAYNPNLARAPRLFELALHR